MELTTLLIATIVFLAVFLWYRRPDPRLPPSPRRPLPIVGHLLYMKPDSRTQMREWHKQCGDIYSLYMGGTLAVVLNGYDLIKEMLVKKADLTSNRPQYFIDEATGHPGKGIIFSSGKPWKEQRSTALSILRAFGMGKNLLAEKIQEEAACFVNYLANHKGKPIDIRVMTNICTSNIICSILIGHRFDYEDKDFQHLMHCLGSLVSDQQNVGLINFVYWLKYTPGDLFKGKKLIVSTKNIMDSLLKMIKEKKRNVVDSSDVCNLIDAYIVERNKKIKAGEPTSLDDDNLEKIMFDLFIGGTETTSTTIYWCILYMLNHPDVQEKVYREIKDKIGTDRTPTIQDKPELTYLNAVTMETLRLSSIIRLSVTHTCAEEVTIRGYTLPKGTYIFPNLDSVLHDEKTWGSDALSFRPERFIDDNGKLKNPEQFIPFGIGRRVCLGEAIAKMELFLFLAFMFQKFQFLPEAPDSVPKIEYVCGGVVVPKAYNVRATERK